MTKNYLRNSNGIVFVFDLTSPTSFEGVDFQAKGIEDIVDNNVVRILAGNKCDLSDKIVSRESAIEYAKEHNMRYIEVSAKKGINIESLFENLVNNCIRNIKELDVVKNELKNNIDNNEKLEHENDEQLVKSEIQQTSLFSLEEISLNKELINVLKQGDP